MKIDNLTWLMGAILLCFGGFVQAGNVSATKHNLSATGVGTLKSPTETKVCVFCHTPHLATPDTPLWNHELPVGQTYLPYTSSTLVSVPGQPNGSSKLCLSCHDGTIALGSVLNLPGRNRIQGNFGDEAGVIDGLESAMPGTSAAMLGTDLRDDHPVSFVYDTALANSNSELHQPSTLMSGSVKPDASGNLQCTSCHDPHTDANPKFLRLASTDAGGYGAQICRTCHNKLYWDTVTNQPHRESLSQWNGAGTNPWFQEGHRLPNDADSTPKANACFSCHQPHNGGGGTKLLARDGEQEVCLACHNGNVASVAKNIDASISKISAHPTKLTDGMHNAERDGASGMVREAQANLDVDRRHAECPDCHNPHAVSAGVSADQTDVGGTNNIAANVLKGVWGVEPSWPGNWQELDQNAGYTVVDDVQYQYQLCLKCHSSYAFGLFPPPEPAGTLGYDSMTDQAKEFNTNNASYHPVAAAGKNDFIMNVVGEGVFDYSSSLLDNLTATSTMSCTNCHSDPDADTGGPKGPHGSEFWPILKAEWGPETGMPGSESHLCFECHDVNVYRYTTTYTNWQKTGYSGMCVGGFCGMYPGGLRVNMHAWHGFVMSGQISCMTCHVAVPHGSNKRALLKYGQDPLLDSGADPDPYNAQERRKTVGVGGSTGWANFGIPSRATVDTIQSGNWVKSDCHGTGAQGSATGGVGCSWAGD